MPPPLPAPLGRAAGTPAVRNAALPLVPCPLRLLLSTATPGRPPHRTGGARDSAPGLAASFCTTAPAFKKPDFFENATRPRPVYDLPVPCLPQFRNEAGVRRGVWRLSDFKREEERLSRARSRNPSDEFSEQTKQAVAAVRNQNRYYAIIQIKGKSFLVTEGDTVTVPGLYEVAVGEVIDINRVREIGSRDFTIFGRDHVSPDYFDIKGTVIEKPRGKDVIVYRYLKGSFRKVKAQHHNFTTFRITKLDVNKLN